MAKRRIITPANREAIQEKRAEIQRKRGLSEIKEMAEQIRLETRELIAEEHIPYDDSLGDSLLLTPAQQQQFIDILTSPSDMFRELTVRQVPRDTRLSIRSFNFSQRIEDDDDILGDIL